jgi:drug/metabolite transporter (DMT)-like permease
LHRQCVPAACLSALLCPLLVWPFATPLDVSTIDLLKLFLFGTTQFGLGLVFLTVGGQMVSATENALIDTQETPLAVAWGLGLRHGSLRWACLAQQLAAAT